jgi:hypothetical protein
MPHKATDSQMLRITTGVAVLLYVTALCWPADGEGVTADPNAQPARWLDAMKDIPLGPLRLDVGGSLRFRYESQSNFNAQRYADTRGETYRQDQFLLHRTRLDFNLRFSKEARFYAEFQDARAYDSDFQESDFFSNNPYWDCFDLRQGYLEWLHIGGSPFGVKVGRQTIHYGDNRIWGPGDWGNVGRYTWDAIKLIADTDVAEVHGMFANRVRYEAHDLDARDDRLDAFGAYAMIKNLPFKLDLFWVGKRTRPDLVVNAKGDRLDLETHTPGFYVDGKVGQRWDYAGTLAHTFGKRDGTDVNAWGANARLGHTFDAPWQPRLGGEFSYGSGDRRPGQGEYRTFDGGFGAVDILYYGRMNLFSWMNIQDYQASFSLSPTKKLKLFADWHIFRLDSSRDAWYYVNGQPQRRDPTGRSGSLVGQELDLMLTYKLNDHWEVLAGYSHFFPGPFLRNTGPSPHADWLFLQVTFSF